jgi:hypothetical protein
LNQGVEVRAYRYDSNNYGAMAREVWLRAVVVRADESTFNALVVIDERTFTYCFRVDDEGWRVRP